jgi:predicted dehydrogenase
MKLGMLGIDARIAAVAAAAIRRGDSVVLAVDVSPEAFPGASVVDDQSLLDPAACDAVLVGSDDWSGERAEAVRLLVQAGRPLLVSHPLELSMLWAWEVEMIRRDINGVLVPLLPERLHPFVARLRQLLEASLAGGGLLGDVESVVLERRLTLRSREAVLRAVARDADLVRVLAGEPARMSALGVTPDTDPANWHSLVVGFSGPTSVPVRWQTTSGGEPGLRLGLQCGGGIVAVVIPDDPSQAWTWSQPGEADLQQAYDPAGLMLSVLDRSLRSGGAAVVPHEAAIPETDDAAVPAATWADAARAVELADAVPRSIAKGRGVDLHQEEFSDLGTFRGTMASLGCGIIMAALVLVVVAALVGGLAHEFGWAFGGWLAGTWPFVALAALGGFLILQFLPLLVASSREHE